MGTKEKVGKIIKKAARILPGIGSYQDKESIRESDKNLRAQISAQLTSSMGALERIKTDIARKGSLSSLKDLDDLTRHMDKLSRAIRFASRGYTGVFDSKGVDETALSKLFEFDRSLHTEIGLVEPLVSKISEKEIGPEPAVLQELGDLLVKIEKMTNEREGLLKRL